MPAPRLRHAGLPAPATGLKAAPEQNHVGLRFICNRGFMRQGDDSMRLILIILLVLLLIGSFPVWPYSTGWGYYPTGGLGLVLLIVLIVILVG
jgi:hypothetical protein